MSCTGQNEVLVLVLAMGMMYCTCTCLYVYILCTYTYIGIYDGGELLVVEMYMWIVIGLLLVCV